MNFTGFSEKIIRLEDFLNFHFVLSLLRKQIALLEESMVQMEKRMQDDIESLEGDYKNKIKKLKEEIVENEILHKEEKLALKVKKFLTTFLKIY